MKRVWGGAGRYHLEQIKKTPLYCYQQIVFNRGVKFNEDNCEGLEITSYMGHY